MTLKNPPPIYLFLLTLGPCLLTSQRTTAATYYVSTFGSNSNSGTSAGSPWRTITHAATKVKAGDKVMIKGGNYGAEQVVIKAVGTASSPIVFEGYDGTPKLVGPGSSGTAFSLSSAKYVTLKNVAATDYLYGFMVNGSSYVTLENLMGEKFRGTIGYSGFGIWVYRTDNSIIRNTTMTDAGAANIILVASHNNLIENIKSYGVLTDNPTDYYFVIQYSHDNVVRDSLVHNKHANVPVHGGHGFIVKDVYYADEYALPHSYNNKFINCTAIDLGEALVAAHPVYNNQFIDCTAYNENIATNVYEKGLRVRDGAHDNLFRNCRIVNYRYGVMFDDTSEGPGTQYTKNNKFENIIIEEPRSNVIYMQNAQSNSFDGCVFYGGPGLFGSAGSNSGNTIKNSIVSGVGSLGAGASFTYTNFHNNKFSAPLGTGNISQDPLFADPSASDFHLRSKGGRWNGTTWVYDSASSPCIDAGDPASSYANEPSPNGGRVNLGAYANTTEASKSGGVQVELGTVSGKVTDKATQSPIDGAAVVVDGSGLSAKTDASGAFQIANIPVGTYTVRATAAGYSPAVKQGVQVAKSQMVTVSFALEKAVLTDLVAHWSFDQGTGDVAVDVTGNGFDGTIHGATRASGKLGSGLSFDGVDDYVEVPADAGLGLAQQITVMAWVKVPLGSRQTIAARWLYGNAAQRAFELDVAEGGNLGFGLSSNGTDQVWLASTGKVTADTWTHVAATSDGIIMRLYVDGQEDIATAAAPSQIRESTAKVQLGRWWTAGSWLYPIKGMLDEVKIYRVALSAAQIQAEAKGQVLTHDAGTGTTDGGGGGKADQRVVDAGDGGEGDASTGSQRPVDGGCGTCVIERSATSVPAPLMVLLVPAAVWILRGRRGQRIDPSLRQAGIAWSRRRQKQAK